MKSIECTSATGLAQLLESYGDEAVFRGQTKHYISGDGVPSIVTSFGRLGCIPEHMLKWTHYALEILRVLGVSSDPDAIAPAQALLQHYGWRSFFVDVTSRWEVAAWFASNTFRSQPVMHMTEDCFGHGVLTIQHVAQYSQLADTGTGHLYVLRRDDLSELGIGLTDLRRFAVGSATPRFINQAASLIGPLSGPLSPEAVELHIAVPAAVLASISSKAMLSTEYLFPPRSADPILELLLSLPWVAASPSVFMPAFRRSLNIPEYDWVPARAYPSNQAFVKRFFISELLHELTPRSWLHATSFYRTPEPIAFATAIEARPVPSVVELLAERKHIAVELDGLVSHPEFAGTEEYGKGVVLTLHDDGLIEISELLVQHPGTHVGGIGVANGWHYSVVDGSLRRVDDSRDCPCGNTVRHVNHLRFVYWLEECLAAGRISRRNDIGFDLLPPT